MRLNLLWIGMAASGLGVGWSGAALGQPTGQALPELSGRAIGPRDDPRLRRRLRRQRRANKRNPYREVRRRRHQQMRSVALRGGGWRFYGSGWTAHVAPDGSVTFDKRSVTWSARDSGVTFDITDASMRAKKKAAYMAAKLRFVRRTAPWRLGLRRAARRRARQVYFAQLPGRLRALWKRGDITTMRKRALLFRLWEECLEPGRTAVSVRAQQARWMILRFIRRRLPALSPQAYTKRELAWMGKRRRGLSRFDPYGRQRLPVLRDR